MAWTPEALRAFEEKVKELFLAAKILAPVHLAGGNEPQLIEIFKGIRPIDWVFGTHRSHLHVLLQGVPPGQVMAEILKGNSMHLNFKDYNFCSSAIVGGCLPIALGVAMAIKAKGQDRQAWCFIGDMSYEAGITHEVIKYARNFDLPLSVVVECNGLSVNTPTDEAWGSKHEHITDGQVRVLEQWSRGKVIRYCYERAFPHINAGKWVEFR